MFAPVVYVAVGMVLLLGVYRIETNRVMKRRAYKGTTRLPMYYATNKKGGDRLVV